ncbi:hypothetical protein LIER_25284 [Lithospermum erythrorhizon]|uniref:Uncharacterized protein n=1 Tax=Lithospermum erythrorhizon TaxID=34254 RepID=A0AAV3R6A7_LITER
MSGPTTAPIVADYVGKTTEPPNIFEESENDDVADNPERGDVSMPSADDTVADTAERPSIKDLVETVTSSVKGTALDNTQGIESVGIPSIIGSDDLSAGNVGDDVTPSVDATNLLDERAEPIVSASVADTLIDEVVEMYILEDVGQENKNKLKKRKHKSGVDAGETYVPKRKLSKEDK